LAAVVLAACGSAGSPPNTSTDRTSTASALRGWDFGPDAVSFVSATQGWALADVGCFRCARVFGTTDGGRNWASLSSPLLPGPKTALLEGLVDIYFADARDGYIFTADRCQERCLLTTRDGGRTWEPISLPPVAQLIGGGDDVYVLSPAGAHRRAALLRETVNSGRWAKLALPPTAAQRVAPDRRRPVLYIAADGTSVALLRRASAGTSPTPAQLGRVWISTDSGENWIARPNPCTVHDGGAALVSIALDHPDALLIDCFDDKQSSQAQAMPS
jgi:hypothetical protein